MSAAAVVAGQVWTSRKHRLVVEQVRCPAGGQAYALVHEVAANGRRPAGRDRHGVKRSLSFRIPLAHFGELLTLVK